MATATSTYSPVWVTGDKTIDFTLKPTGKYVARTADERLHVPVKLLWHKGGVFLLKEMIEAALDGKIGQVHCIDEPSETDLIAYGSGFNHSFAVLRDYPIGLHERSRMRDRHIPEQGYTDQVHRISEYLGFRSIAIDHKSPAKSNFTNPVAPYPKVIVIDDANLGFRESAVNWRGIIPDEGSSSDRPWILLKMSFEILEGALWDELKSRLENKNDWLGSRLVIQTSVARLRDLDVEISKNLSWERSVYDTLDEIDKNKKLEHLKKCPWLVISFGPSGALLVKRNDTRMQWRLICNRELMEGEWAARNKNGMMFGYGSALCASLARELALKDEPSFARAVRSGLVAMQRLYDEGFLIEGRELKSPSRIFRGFDLLHQQLSATNWRTAYDRVTCPPLLRSNRQSSLELHEDTLPRIAREGVNALKKALPRAPVATFGDLITVDREEIEGLHAIYNLIDSYCGDGSVSLGSKPLAIAVFGAPGAGKGYAIEQLTKQWQDEDVIKSASFNLSQFSSPLELVGALHQVRDIALEGKVPLVLWDEFDSPVGIRGQLGWLRYFLGPIQDGRFQQAEKTHLIGPSIFVFAGGTSSSFQEFSQKAEKARRELKAVDFLSRVRGYINIADVNAPGGSSPNSALMLRRALVLHSLFGKHSIAKRKVDGYIVDDGIVHAFLAIPEFKHGVRSMEAIVQMCRRKEGQPFDRSSLASQEQLNLHVDGQNFLDIVRAHENRSRN
ncbi:hypothetical protein ACLQ18_12745 [Streptomyces sp. DT193]|uniref:hypothetical protein n=1 Tax=Streptomyces sp. DT193 TaxID=3393418 RepID=UPI003CEA4062